MWHGKAVSSPLLKQRHSFCGMQMKLLCPQLEGRGFSSPVGFAVFNFHYNFSNYTYSICSVVHIHSGVTQLPQNETILPHLSALPAINLPNAAVRYRGGGVSFGWLVGWFCRVFFFLFFSFVLLPG